MADRPTQWCSTTPCGPGEACECRESEPSLPIRWSIEWVEAPQRYMEDPHSLVMKHGDDLRCGLNIICKAESVGIVLVGDDDHPTFRQFAILSDGPDCPNPIPACEDCYDVLVELGVKEVRS